MANPTTRPGSGGQSGGSGSGRPGGGAGSRPGGGAGTTSTPGRYADCDAIWGAAGRESIDGWQLAGWWRG